MESKKIYKYINIIVTLFIPIISFAIDYVPLENSPLGDGSQVSVDNLGSFLSSAYNFGIAIAVTLAAIMIMYGGVLFMTTDSWSKKSDGIEKIKDALWGLGLALISYLILYTINSKLVDFSSNKIINP